MTREEFDAIREKVLRGEMVADAGMEALWPTIERGNKAEADLARERKAHSVIEREAIIRANKVERVARAARSMMNVLAAAIDILQTLRAAIQRAEEVKP